MTQNEFEQQARAAESIRRSAQGGEADFWAGYIRGLRRHYHGERFGTDAEHLQWMDAAESDSTNRRMRGAGYVAGFEGKTVAVAAELVSADGDTIRPVGRPIGSLKPDALTSQIPATRCSDDLLQWLQQRAVDEMVNVPTMVRKLLTECKKREDAQ